jgi:two-component system sensor histidine kinase DesK
MDTAARWERVLWASPWLLFLLVPISDLVSTDRPTGIRVLAGAALVVFTTAYLSAFSRIGGRLRLRPDLVVVVVLGAALALSLGVAWVGLMVYVSAAAAATLPGRWAWPTVAGAVALCVAVAFDEGAPGMLFLPAICLLSAFALVGTRVLLSVNGELREAREELARTAVEAERLRFARDLHDLLGHSLSLIALKSELAGRLAETSPSRARSEMADVEAAARQALLEVRDAVTGYRRVTLAAALAEGRAALSGAGIRLALPATTPVLPQTVDAALGWVVREATTNVLRHSGARSVQVDLAADDCTAVLVIADDGRGPTGSSDAKEGSGLAGLSERVAAVGGRLLTSEPQGGGYVVRVEVPLEDAVVGGPTR